MGEAALLAGDWGTTNLRVWMLDSAGLVLARRDFPFGVGRLAPGEAALRLQTTVRPALSATNRPVLLCGMAGSGLGLGVAPYVDCPAQLDDLASELMTHDNDVRVAPGLRCQGLTDAPDVMRGEETQILGWLAQDPDRRRGARLVCLPGTHAKWARIEEGRVIRFVTAMTGELFAVLSEHSLLKCDRTLTDPDAFQSGLTAAGDGDALTARLFSARSRVVGGHASPDSTSSYLSGLLIGSEVASAPRLLSEGVTHADLIGEPDLCHLYGQALEARGWSYSVHDGQTCAIAGLYALWRAL